MHQGCGAGLGAVIGWALALILLPTMAPAGGLAVIAALSANGVGLGAAIWSVYGTAITQVLASVLINAALSAMGKKPNVGAHLAQDLQQPTSLPVWRFVYGQGWAVGTPTGVIVRGTVMYGCWILNSRPSVGPFDVLFDKRKLTLTGDAYDFDGPGGSPTAPDILRNIVNIWIGRGDQTSPPARFLRDVPDAYKPTDAWRGMTVVWLRLDCGGPKERAERWPSTPPEVVLNGKWSPVWDPRDADQDPNDPATWGWSANQALCALDALRRNPIKPYADDHLWLDTWRWAADVGDEPTPVKGGGTIPRYEVNGTLAYSDGAELEDQLDPLMIAGAARFVRARGQLGIIPGTAQTPQTVLTDLMDGTNPTFQLYEERDRLATSIAGTFLAPDRAYEDTTLPTYVLEGAQDEDGGLDQPHRPDLSLVTDHRQGQRVQKILLMRTRMQKKMTAAFPPEALDLVAGSWTRTDFAAPFTRWSGLWEVEATAPAFLEAEGQGVDARCTMTLRQTSPAVYAWDAETEEQEVETYTVEAERPSVQPPSNVVVDMSDTHDRITSGVLEPRFRITFDASASGSVTGYEWQVRLEGEDWPDDSQLVVGSYAVSAPVNAYGAILSQTAIHDLRIRAVGNRGASDWVTITGLARNFALIDVAVASASGGYRVTGKAPGNQAFAGIRIYRGASLGSAVLDYQAMGLTPGATLSISVTGRPSEAGSVWVVPLTQTRTEGRPDGPHPVFIIND